MNALQQMAQKSKALGCRAGESAAAWRKRDPKAANEFAAYLREHHAQIVAAMSRAVLP